MRAPAVDRQPKLEADPPAANTASPNRGWLLRLLYRVYTNYLGVTPPKPEQERIAAVVLVGGVIGGLIAIVAIVFFLWKAMAQLGASR